VETGYHPPVEEYLETIHALEEEGTPVIGARIAERLGRSAPSVSEMLDRLAEEGYIARDGRVIRLTSDGERLATSVVRKHRLAERLLTDIIGLEWHKVHDEAGRWEHVISADVEERLIAILGDPATCPHGNPIPGSKGQRVADVVPLHTASVGATVRLERIAESVEINRAALRYLDEHHFIPGSAAQVKEKSADGWCTLNIKTNEFAIAPELSGQLFVALVS
jgi:DtxR family Mn-dependent transcriptional regulator